ncbi:MAG: hypothetical protein AYK19_02945 [Theionarchaea archaeon DG-70-1]|nr:MAG: hypothetical protein AYK19_02945 [Theionarchaea archaeon DG-70-1]
MRKVTTFGILMVALLLAMGTEVCGYEKYSELILTGSVDTTMYDYRGSEFSEELIDESVQQLILQGRELSDPCFTNDTVAFKDELKVLREKCKIQNDEWNEEEYEEFMEEWMRWWEEWMRWWEELLEELEEILEEGIEEWVKKKIGERVEGVKESIEERMEEIGESIEDLFEEIIDGFSRFFRDDESEIATNNDRPVITSAFWACGEKYTEWIKCRFAEDGDKSAMVAVIKNAEGMKAVFEVYESDFDGLKKDLIIRLNAIVDNGEAVALWEAQWMNDGLMQGDPEYVFDVKVDSVSAESENKLEVRIKEFTNKGEDMPFGLNFQGTENDQKDIIIHIEAPPSVDKGEVFEVKIEVFPALDSTHESSWIFLTEENINNTRLFMDKGGFKMDKTSSKISIDYILEENTDTPFPLFTISTNLATAGKLVLTHSIARSIGFNDLFSLLGYATGTGGSPDEWALKIGKSYLLELADKIRDDIIKVLNENGLDPSFILSRQRIGDEDRKNTIVYLLKLKAPDNGGDYRLVLNVEYSTLYFYYRADPSQTLHRVVFDNLAVIGNNLIIESQRSKFEFVTNHVYESVTIHVRD